MMEFTLDYASLAKKLEAQELESVAGRASPQVYGQLLAIYLLFNDLSSAKFLWKRIPEEIKRDNAELSIIWSVGKHMWKKEYSEIYKVIKSCPTWPNHLKNIMNLIIESTRQRVESLISRAYSSIKISHASCMLGLTIPETLKIAAARNWTYEEDTGFISTDQQNSSDPKVSSMAVIENRAELLEKLTDYIIFLEGSQHSN